jgi:shikimate kinase
LFRISYFVFRIFYFLISDVCTTENPQWGEIPVRVFLTGVGCVGKTTTGRALADLLCVKFFDVDDEIETFFEISIERLQARFLTVHSFRNEAAKALIHLLNRPDSRNSVIALPPSGLMGGYLRAVKKSDGLSLYYTTRRRISWRESGSTT